MQRALDRLYSGCLYLAGALLVSLCLLVLYSIVARLLGLYAGGASDIAGYLMAAATFLALAPTFRARGHIYVSLLTSRLTPSSQHYLSLAAHALMFATTAALAFYLSRLAYFSYQYQERSEGADAILLYLPQLPVALGSIIFAVSVAHSGIGIWLNPRAAMPPPAAEQTHE